MLSGFIPDAWKGEGSDMVWTLGVLAGTLGAYAAIKRVDERVAKVLAFPLVVVFKIIGALLRIPRWVWRQLWRGTDGVSRGPMTRIALRFTAWLKGVIRGEVLPLDERVAALEIRVGEGFGAVAERLDRGSQIMAEHSSAIAGLEATLKDSGPVPITPQEE